MLVQPGAARQVRGVGGLSIRMGFGELAAMYGGLLAVSELIIFFVRHLEEATCGQACGII